MSAARPRKGTATPGGSVLPPLGITADTGFLIALERNEKRAVGFVQTFKMGGVLMTLPVVALAEWWRSPTKAYLVQAFAIEPMTEKLARLAGEARAAIRDSGIVDAIVMASAAQRGDTVYTSDFDDMQRLQGHFPNVRIVKV